MSEISFIHLSDIHFHKLSGNSVDIDTDLRNAILTDIEYNAKDSIKNIQGILVGGDIAFAGQKQEYDHAKEFLKKMTEVLGIDEKSIYCVPGNHDVSQQVSKECISVYTAQCNIDNAQSLDQAEAILQKHITDTASPNLLFKTLEGYNEFAAAYGCNIDSENPFWTTCFTLDCGMKLKIRGMNSCIISNQDDHKEKDKIRYMFINQSQIPSYEKDVIWMGLCHHPVEFWKFFQDVKGKLDKRVEIQLYGHKHEQTVDKNNDRLLISAGATHPTRGRDWNPRYNWISFECVRLPENKDRYIEVKTYPRVLSTDRDRFVKDRANCDQEKPYFIYRLNVDKKRRESLCDRNQYIESVDDQKKIGSCDLIVDGIKKEITYNFFELSYVQQSEILANLDLLKEEYEGRRYINVIREILDDAKNKECLAKFYEMVKEKAKCRRN